MCLFLCFRFTVYLLDVYFHQASTKPSGWTHIVLNYIGPNNGQGIKMFIDGAEVASDTTKDIMFNYPAGDGRIVVGRRFTNRDRDYASIQVDELVFFNCQLHSAHIQIIYNSA